MFVIAGVSGHTGRVVADTLLQKGKKVRVVVRSADKGEPWKRRGAEVAVASLEDAAALGQALAGAEGAYLLLPPDLTTPDYMARGHRLVAAIKQAVQKAALPHVVFLSSVGAQHAAGTGPIKAVHVGERELGALPATRFTFLRAAYFMENLLGSLPLMKEKGMLPVFGGGEGFAFPMVATRDIGETAARALLEPPAKTQVIELAGPAEYSMNDAARLFGAALGRPVTATALPIEGLVPAFTGMGASESVAKEFREMTEGLGKGIVAWEGGSARHLRGKVTLDELVKSAVKS